MKGDQLSLSLGPALLSDISFLFISHSYAKITQPVFNSLGCSTSGPSPGPWSLALLGWQQTGPPCLPPPISAVTSGVPLRGDAPPGYHGLRLPDGNTAAADGE